MLYFIHLFYLVEIDLGFNVFHNLYNPFFLNNLSFYFISLVSSFIIQFSKV